MAKRVIDKYSQQGVVITFHTTTDAMAAREAAESGVPELEGRMIPVPRKLSAGCGLAWLVNEHGQADVCAVLARLGLDYERVVPVDQL